MNRDQPRVSILMPVYNSGRYLRAAIDSIRSQTFEELELIAVDDGSTDESLSILRKYETLDSRVKVISRPNTGIVAALNEALAHARGTYVARMDADDICLGHRIGKQVAYLDANPDVVLLGTRIRKIDPEGDPIADGSVITSAHEIERALLSGKANVLVHPTIMVRRDAIDRIGGYRPFDTSEDLDLYLRLVEYGTASNLDEVLLLYRVHLSSITATNRRQRVIANRRIILGEAHARRGLAPPASIRAYGGSSSLADFHERLCLSAAVAGNPSTSLKHIARLVRLQGYTARTLSTAGRMVFRIGRSRIRLLLKGVRQ